MGAGDASTDEKTSKNSAKRCKTAFWRQNDRYSSKFKFLNSKFELQASFCITNLKYYIYEASAESGHRGGLHRRENAKTAFWRQNEPLQLKIQIFECKFEFQASFRITNLRHYIYEASAEYGRRGGLHRRENVEKQGKTGQNSDFGAKTTVTALKIQIFEFKI